jgi:hypothetical protein
MLIGIFVVKESVDFAAEEDIAEGALEGRQGRGAGLKGLEEPPDLEIERRIVATIPIEGVLGTDCPALQEHPGCVQVAGEAGVVESHGVPRVPRIDVDAQFQQILEALHITCPRSLEHVPRRYLLQGQRNLLLVGCVIEIV